MQSNIFEIIDQLPDVFPIIKMDLWFPSNKLVAPYILIELNSISPQFNQINNQYLEQKIVAQSTYKFNVFIAANKFDDCINILNYFISGIHQIKSYYPISLGTFNPTDVSEGNIKNIHALSGEMDITIPVFENSSLDLTVNYGGTVNIIEQVSDGYTVEYISSPEYN